MAVLFSYLLITGLLLPLLCSASPPENNVHFEFFLGGGGNGRPRRNPSDVKVSGADISDKDIIPDPSENDSAVENTDLNTVQEGGEEVNVLNDSDLYDEGEDVELAVAKYLDDAYDGEEDRRWPADKATSSQSINFMVTALRGPHRYMWAFRFKTRDQLCTVCFAIHSLQGEVPLDEEKLRDSADGNDSRFIHHLVKDFNERMILLYQQERRLPDTVAQEVCDKLVWDEMARRASKQIFTANGQIAKARREKLVDEVAENRLKAYNEMLPILKANRDKFRCFADYGPEIAEYRQVLLEAR